MFGALSPPFGKHHMLIQARFDNRGRMEHELKGGSDRKIRLKQVGQLLNPPFIKP